MSLYCSSITHGDHLTAVYVVSDRKEKKHWIRLQNLLNFIESVISPYVECDSVVKLQDAHLVDFNSDEFIKLSNIKPIPHLCDEWNADDIFVSYELMKSIIINIEFPGEPIKKDLLSTIDLVFASSGMCVTGN